MEKLIILFSFFLFAGFNANAQDWLPNAAEKDSSWIERSRADWNEDGFDEWFQIGGWFGYLAGSSYVSYVDLLRETDRILKQAEKSSSSPDINNDVLPDYEDVVASLKVLERDRGLGYDIRNGNARIARTWIIEGYEVSLTMDSEGRTLTIFGK